MTKRRGDKSAQSDKPGEAQKDAPAVPAVLSPQLAERKEEIEKQLLVMQSSMSFSGPIPPPEILEKYEQILPGSAGRLITMAENQSRHRQHLEKTVVEGEVKRAWWGLWTGYTLGLAGIGGSVALGLYGQQVAASVLCGTTLVSLVSVFVIGAVGRRKERQEKLESVKEGRPPVEQRLPNKKKGK